MTTIKIEKNDKKTLRHVAETIKQQVKKTNVKLEFNSQIDSKTFRYLINKADLKYYHFKDKIKISGINKIQMYDYIWEATHGFKLRPWHISIVSVLFISLVGFFIYKENMKDINNILNIKDKINYVTKQRIKDLNYYYKTRGESFDIVAFKVAYEINKNCKKFDLNPNLVISIINHESQFFRYAISSVGAVGYMQIYLKYWGNLITNTNVNSAFREDCNIETGCYILKFYLDKNKNDVYKALLNYNGGDIYKTDNKTVINNVTFDYIQDIITTMNDLQIFDYKEKK